MRKEAQGHVSDCGCRVALVNVDGSLAAKLSSAWQGPSIADGHVVPKGSNGQMQSITDGGQVVGP